MLIPVTVILQESFLEVYRIFLGLPAVSWVHVCGLMNLVAALALDSSGIP